MAKKDKRKSSADTSSERPVFNDLQESTLHSVWGIILLVAAIFFLLAAFNIGGIVGIKTHLWLGALLGVGYYLVPILLVILSLSFFSDHNRRFPLSKSIGSFFFFFSGLGIFHLIKESSGGIIGKWVAAPLLKFFDVPTGFIFLFALLIISILVIFDSALKKEHFMIWRHFKRAPADPSEEVLDELETGKIDEAAAAVEIAKMKAAKKAQEAQQEDTEEDEEESGGMLAAIKRKMGGGQPTEAPEQAVQSDMIQVSRKSILLGKNFVPPPLSLLEIDKGKPQVGDIKANANIIKRTLQNFGIDVEMDEISIGPSVTRYSLKPAEGVKLSRILGLQNNLALALAAHPIRIEAPIPGKALVGIEIPNSVKTTVRLGSLLSQDDYQKSEKPLLYALGKGVSGKSYFADLARAPHLLIAGATGSGKSITIHAIICSLLYRNSPDNLRFIMIDPKRVELTQYDKIGHLLTPVIKDAKKAILALKWAAKEMDRRYDLLEKNSVRDIQSYHKNVLMPALEQIKKTKGSEDDEVTIPDTMPYIVIVIDELADIMQTYPRELEAAIVRLAQMSRAVGIHLILSTQRPSVNVITGLIKANVPSRIALQVASQIDSRTILDTRGAEELLGAGDMLFLSADMSTPQRVQSAFLSESELKGIVKHLVDNADSLPDEVSMTGESIVGTSAVNDPVFSSGFDESADDEEDDDLYEEAKDLVMKAGKASTSYIQRKLRVGYARAARLMDILESRGVIGPADGAKPREVIGYQDSGGESSDDMA
jgi:S-DNA-T family DNA segregation ATPase FtsK/SpoIIIE